jgi:hypothetical protein
MRRKYPGQEIEIGTDHAESRKRSPPRFFTDSFELLSAARVITLHGGLL